MTAMAAGQPTQAVRGIITDRVSEKPLAGVTITVAGLSIGAVSDSLGRYVLPAVPLGR